MEREAINTVEEAIKFLRTIDFEVIGIWQGWILKEMSETNLDFELTCDTNADLIEHARFERDMVFMLARDSSCDLRGKGEALAAVRGSDTQKAVDSYGKCNNEHNRRYESSHVQKLKGGDS